MSLFILSMPPTNPGFIASIPQPLAVVGAMDTTTYVLFPSEAPGLWFFKIDFSDHPLIAEQGLYATALEYVDVTPDDDTLVVTSSSIYNNCVGFFLSGGTSQQTYTVTAGITLSNTQHISNCITINVR